MVLRCGLALLLLSLMLGACPTNAPRKSSVASPSSGPSPTKSQLKAELQRQLLAEASSESPTPRPEVTVQYSQPCSVSQIELLPSEPFSEATGQHTNLFPLRNVSSRGCYLKGYPEIVLHGRNDRILPFKYHNAGDQMITNAPPRLVQVSPGGTVYFATNKYRCDIHEYDQAATIHARLPGTNKYLIESLATGAGGQVMGYCGPGDPGSVVDVTPIVQFADDTQAQH